MKFSAFRSGDARIHRADGNVLAPVHLQRTAKLSWVKLKASGFRFSTPSLHADMGGKAGEREVARFDGIGAIVHLGIALPEPLGMQHGLRQHILALYRGMFAAAHHASQILKDQHP
jgi:hypothetical protein